MMYQQQQQHEQQQAQPHHPLVGSPSLPEAAPAPKTDPVELSLLSKYLAVVRQTQVRVYGCVGEVGTVAVGVAAAPVGGVGLLLGGLGSPSHSTELCLQEGNRLGGLLM